MKIYSEKTGKQYQSVEECLSAEKKFDEEKAKQEAKKAELAEVRKNRAKEVEDAFSAVEEAKKHYLELRNNFVKDYGSFHMTFSDNNMPLEDIFGNFFHFF